MMTEKSFVQRRPKFKYNVAPLWCTDKTLPSTRVPGAGLALGRQQSLGASLVADPRRDPRRARRDQRLLQGLPGVSGKGEGHQPAVAVAVGIKLRQPQRLPAGELLPDGAGGFGYLHRGQPQFAAVGRRQRAAVAHAGDPRHPDGGQLASIVRRRLRR
jgi:hypothetical protein